MARVTTKLQVTIPKAIADRYGIRPGDDLEWVAAGDAIRVSKQDAPPANEAEDTLAERLRRFDEATKRQARRERAKPRQVDAAGGRGWTRDALYERGRAR